MALVQIGFELSVSLVDNGGNTTNRVFSLVATDHATATTDAGTILTALDAVTDSVVSGYRIVEVYGEDAFAFPSAGVENENQASLTLNIDGVGLKKANYKIPAPVIGLFTAPTGSGANVVDVSDAALNTFIDVFETGGIATLSDGETLNPTTPIDSGKRISAKSLRG